MKERKVYVLKLETGIVTPELAITKYHPLENDLQAQDSTAASHPDKLQSELKHHT